MFARRGGAGPWRAAGVDLLGNVVGGLRIKGQRKAAKHKRMNDDDFNSAMDDGRDATDVPF